jgi:hypothetical protein
MITSELTKTTLSHIDGYLTGRESGEVVSDWAMEVLSEDGSIESPLVEETIVALASLEHDEDRFNTAREDLEFFRECLLGKRSFEPADQVVKRHVH